jgi:hypothetical protein
MASSCKCELLEIPTPFRLQNSRVLLLEPVGSCAPDLGKRLLEGTYDKPFISLYWPFAPMPPCATGRSARASRPCSRSVTV